jgi:hypothetical protein
MKKNYIYLILAGLLSSLIIYYYFKQGQVQYDFGTLWTDTFKQYASDSCDLKKILGDTFSIANRQNTPGQIRSGKLLLHLRRIIDGEVKDGIVNDSMITYLAIIDIHKKQVAKIYRIAQKQNEAYILYPRLDYYRDTLYISCFQNYEYVMTIDTKTDQQDKVLVDPCTSSPGAEQIIRIGRNYYILRKPYAAAVIDWFTGYCLTKNAPLNNTGSNNWIAEPISENVNLICVGVDNSNKTAYYQAFNASGELKWSYASKNNIYLTYKDNFLEANGNYLRFIGKENGQVQKTLKIDTAGTYNLIANTSDCILCNKIIKDSLVGCCDRYTYYEFKLINPDEGSVKSSRKVGPVRGGITYLNNYLIVDCFVLDSDKMGQSNKVIQSIYSLNDLKEVEEKVQISVKRDKYKKYLYYNHTDYATQLNLKDIATGKDYVLDSKGVLYW